MENVGRFSDDLLAVLKLFKRQQFQHVVIIHVLKNNLSGSVSQTCEIPIVFDRITL